MIDIVSGIATVPAIVALVNAAKRVGLPARWALILAIVLGVGLNLAVWAWADYGWFTAASSGLLLGLGAAGLYDLTPADPKPQRAWTIDEDPAPF